MPLLKTPTRFDFMGRRGLAFAFSGTLILIAIVSVAVRGLNFGLDFTGGVLVEVDYGRPVQLENVRTALSRAGYTDALVQNFGTASDVLIRLPPVEAGPAAAAPGAAAGGGGATPGGSPSAGANADQSSTANPGANLGEQVLQALRMQDPNVQLRETQYIGPQVGANLVEAGELSMLFTLILVFGYVMLRFRWKFAAGAVAALVHDTVITIGFFSVFHLQFDLTVVAAILAVIGYSLNDTIVVYDRIRENFRTMRRGSASDIMNAAINQTLSRTINTSLTVILVLIALLTLGGDSVRGFSIALIVGTVIGTYSSIYIASALALLLDVTPADMIPAKRAEVDELP